MLKYLILLALLYKIINCGLCDYDMNTECSHSIDKKCKVESEILFMLEESSVIVPNCGFEKMKDYVTQVVCDLGISDTMRVGASKYSFSSTTSIASIGSDKADLMSSINSATNDETSFSDLNNGLRGAYNLFRKTKIDNNKILIIVSKGSNVEVDKLLKKKLQEDLFVLIVVLQLDEMNTNLKEFATSDYFYRSLNVGTINETATFLNQILCVDFRYFKTFCASQPFFIFEYDLPNTYIEKEVKCKLEFIEKTPYETYFSNGIIDKVEGKVKCEFKNTNLTTGEYQLSITFNGIDYVKKKQINILNCFDFGTVVFFAVISVGSVGIIGTGTTIGGLYFYGYRRRSKHPNSNIKDNREAELKYRTKYKPPAKKKAPAKRKNPSIRPARSEPLKRKAPTKRPNPSLRPHKKSIPSKTKIPTKQGIPSRQTSSGRKKIPTTYGGADNPNYVKSYTEKAPTYTKQPSLSTRKKTSNACIAINDKYGLAKKVNESMTGKAVAVNDKYGIAKRINANPGKKAIGITNNRLADKVNQSYEKAVGVSSNSIAKKINAGKGKKCIAVGSSRLADKVNQSYEKAVGISSNSIARKINANKGKKAVGIHSDRFAKRINDSYELQKKPGRKLGYLSKKEKFGMFLQGKTVEDGKIVDAVHFTDELDISKLKAKSGYKKGFGLSKTEKLSLYAKGYTTENGVLEKVHVHGDEIKIPKGRKLTPQEQFYLNYKGGAPKNPKRSFNRTNLNEVTDVVTNQHGEVFLKKGKNTYEQVVFKNTKSVNPIVIDTPKKSTVRIKNPIVIDTPKKSTVRIKNPLKLNSNQSYIIPVNSKGGNSKNYIIPVKSNIGKKPSSITTNIPNELYSSHQKTNFGPAKSTIDCHVPGAGKNSYRGLKELKRNIIDPINKADQFIYKKVDENVFQPVKKFMKPVTEPMGNAMDKYYHEPLKVADNFYKEKFESSVKSQGVKNLTYNLIEGSVDAANLALATIPGPTGKTKGLHAAGKFIDKGRQIKWFVDNPASRTAQVASGKVGDVAAFNTRVVRKVGGKILDKNPNLFSNNSNNVPSDMLKKSH